MLLPGRLGKQCRERWFNHLDPTVKKTEWTPHEDEVLFNAQVRLASMYAVCFLYLRSIVGPNGRKPPS